MTTTIQSHNNSDPIILNPAKIPNDAKGIQHLESGSPNRPRASESSGFRRHLDLSVMMQTQTRPSYTLIENGEYAAAATVADALIQINSTGSNLEAHDLARRLIDNHQIGFAEQIFQSFSNKHPHPVPAVKGLMGSIDNAITTHRQIYGAPSG